jgi:hypothetical protein
MIDVTNIPTILLAVTVLANYSFILIIKQTKNVVCDQSKIEQVTHSLRWDVSISFELVKQVPNLKMCWIVQIIFWISFEKRLILLF